VAAALRKRRRIGVEVAVPPLGFEKGADTARVSIPVGIWVEREVVERSFTASPPA